MGEGAPIFSYVFYVGSDHFVGGINFEFQYSRDFQKNEYFFWLCQNCGYFFGVNT